MKLQEVRRGQIRLHRALQWVCNNVTGYRISGEKSVSFLYVNINPAQREIKKTVPLTIAPNIINSLGIDLTKEVKDTDSEKYKTTM